MSPEPERHRSGFRFSDPYQRDVHERLQRLVSDGTAAFWQDACALMSAEPEISTTSHLVGHLLREIESALRDVLAVPSKEHLPLCNEQKRHEAEVKAALKDLSIPAEHPAAEFWLTLADPQSSATFWRYAHRSNLERPRPVDQEFRQFFERTTQFLVYILRRVEDNWLRVSNKVLDGLVKRDLPTQSDIDVLRRNVPQCPVSLGYFFAKLGSAKWLEPLRNAGFFSALPEPVSEGDLLRFPPWPPGLYLVHMASVDPQSVASIISNLSKTENDSVHWHILDAALAMPASRAASLVDRVKECVRGLYSFGIGHKVLKLVERLLDGNECDAAMSIAEALLDLSNADEDKKRAIKRYGSGVRHDYEDALRQIGPILTKTADAAWIRLLVRCLSGAIRLDDERNAGSTEDDSSIWCNAVEKQGAPVTSDIKVLLLVALRQAAETVIREKPEKTDQVFEAVREANYKIFGRLEIHLLRLFPKGRENRIREILGSREAYEEYSHEYRMLLAEHFRHLPEDLQRQYLQWVGEKPDAEKAKAWWKQVHSRDVDEKEILAGWEQGQLHRLAGLEEWLPPEWQARYRELVAKHYEPAAPGYVVPRSEASFVGPETPKSADELTAMTLDELLAFLREWNPQSGRFDEPSPEGLGRTLQQIVAKSPERFASAVEFLKDLQPTYVRHILCGLGIARGSGIKFDWDLVLGLCKWVMLQPVTLGQQSNRLFADEGWNWTQGEVARLLLAGLQSDKTEIPVTLRNVVWECIVPLTNSSDPTPAREDEGIKDNREPCQLAINSIRGQGMELVIRYALWVRRHLEIEPDAEKQTAEGFATMREVQEVLDKHLDAKIDPSLAIRSVYGQWFPWLAMLDERWAVENANRIFPLDERSATFLAAAWDTYIVMNRWYDAVYRILRPQYAAAVRSLGQPKEDVGHLGNPDMSLAEHLIVLRARSVISDTDQLWQAFLNIEREDVRRRAISFVADVFRENEKISQALADFLKSFIETRLGVAEGEAKQGKPSPEWEAFGWFFEPKNLDDDWLLAQLERVLAITGGVVESDFHVFERLPGIAEKHPQRVVKCLRTIVGANPDVWAVAGHEKDIKQVIQAARRASDVGAQQAAEDFINYLASRGWFQFRDL